ncbi:hypothetical protein [Neorhodopirellula pilleata]|uniref:Glycosyltransferase RgtA/B/C/D-like domain-containing protein n=1 Tax=Neorhodopirellula pilleata TaxID=2714738 RepID=A0A5C5ZQA7_9BACT|nr:hypothetical protein [Neorhodopirellula pilleata]TWT89386.1 hypothetical protein Pla100_55490 [Neorhodopirellula pilleata]
MRKHEQPQQRRIRMHFILIAITLALVSGRIATVINPEGDSAFLSANDRSRWVSVAALVEKGTFAIDELIVIKTPKGHRLWDTIDKVRHVGPDGRLHYYSSKPTLLTTLIAGVYKALHWSTGLSMTDQPIYVPRMLLLLINVPTLALFLVTMMWTVERTDTTDFAKRLVVAAACFGTMLTPFAIALNNHLFAAAATSLTLWIYLRCCERIHDDFSSLTYMPRFWPWFVAGTSAAFTVACELPALSMFCLWGVLFAWEAPRSIPGFLLGAMIVAAGIFGTNYWAHQSWRTPYAHRGYGDVQDTFEWNVAAQDSEKAVADSLRDALRETQPLESAKSILVRSLFEGGYAIVAEFEQDGKFREIQYKVEQDPASKSGARWNLRSWDDWYEYPRSYWRSGNRRGVDLGEPSRAAYLFHATVGHYGLFSLTPIWILMPFGLAYRCLKGPGYERRLAVSVALSSLVCFAFYVARPEIDRNYGGVSICFRWMLWFAPLWLYGMLAEADSWSEKAVGRIMLGVLLAASVFSMSTSLDSPWQSPWLYRFASFLGWLS